MHYLKNAEPAYMNESKLYEVSLQNGTCILYSLKQGERMHSRVVFQIF
jgi:hypothetical protein